VCDESDLDALPERERTVIEWLDRYVLEPGSIDDELTGRVLEHLRDDQLIEIAIVAGATQFLNHYCTAFAIPPARP
jgi:alkylhydroperoxidase family enzyme